MIVDPNLSSSTSISIFKQEAESAEISQLLRKTCHVNQIFELILEQCVANYYGDNTIPK